MPFPWLYMRIPQAQEGTAGHWPAKVLRKWQHNLSGCCFRFLQQSTAELASFLTHHVNSRHLRTRGTCPTAGGSWTWRAWGTWAWRARRAWDGGRCQCLNEGNKLCSAHEMLVEPGYSGCLGTLGESVKICIHDFERAWKIIHLKALKKTHSTIIYTCFRKQWWNLAIAINMFEHVCPTHLSWLVMSYAALTFSMDPQIHRKDNDTFFQVCPRGV